MIGRITQVNTRPVAFAFAVAIAVGLSGCGDQAQSPGYGTLDRKAGSEILPRMVPQTDDLPVGFEEWYTSLETIEDRANLVDDPDYPRRLESWDFLLAYVRLYEREPAQSTFDISFEIWLHGSEVGASEAFLDGALELDYPDVTEEPITNFPVFGDESKGVRYAGIFGHDQIQMEGYAVIMRVGQFLALVETFSPSGRASQDETIGVARKLESLMIDEVSR